MNGESEVFEFLWQAFEQFGLPGLGVATLAYIAYVVRGLAESLKINPNLGYHLNDMGADLKTVKSNVLVMARRQEDIWNEVRG